MADTSQYTDSASECNVPSKACLGCGIVKPITDFTPLKAGRLGVTGRCKRCRAKKPGGVYVPASERKPQDRSEGMRWVKIREKYGLTKEDYNGMLARQGWACAICRSTEPKGRFGRFMVDHCHQTGKVRGLLCAGCNTALGTLGDTSESLRRALAYLDGNPEPCVNARSLR